MKLKYLAATFLLALFVLFIPSNAKAQQTSFCDYSSTQSRVQKNLINPWVEELNIPLRRPLNGWTRFKVGSFHNGTGVFATDTTIKVIGPGIYKYAKNGQTIWVNREGRYVVIVTTRGQFGQDCYDTSYVNVRRPKYL